uniref:Secreted protein n=1 Tax=Arundo donax TaxID=35708 RepID=A0A0A9HLH0_ARUDO
MALLIRLLLIASSVSFSQSRAKITLILELRWPAQKPSIVLFSMSFPPAGRANDCNICGRATSLCGM